MPQLQLLKALTYAAVLTDPRGVVCGWNNAAQALYGWTADEMIGRPIIERFPPAVRAEMNEHFLQLAAGGEWDGEFEDYHKDGSRIWIEAHIHPVRDADGTITGILGVANAITPNRAAEIAQERHDRYAAAILNCTSAHVAVLDSDGRICHVNRLWKQFAEDNNQGGFAPQFSDVGTDYVGLCRASSEIMAKEAAPAANGIEDVLRGKRSYFVLEYPHDTTTETRWFAMHVTPLTTESGGAVVAHYDITARKQAELAATNHSRRTELALSAANMGVWTQDLATGRVDWSPEVYRIIGVPKFDCTIEDWYRFVHPDEIHQLTALVNQSIDRRMPFTAEFRIVRPDGEVRWLANVAHVECDESSKAIRIIGTVQDITDRKRSEAALKSYNQILEQMVAGADLKKILDEVIGLVEVQLPGSLCSVLIVDKATNCLRFAAGSSLPAEYNRAVDGVPIAAKAGSCGTASFLKTTVTTTDIATDPLWEDYRDLALKHGLRSCVSVPILSSGSIPGFEKGDVIGTFALYNRIPGNFDPVTYAILTSSQERAQTREQAGSEIRGQTGSVIEATHLAGVAIERDFVGQAIREREERFRAVFDSAPLAIYVKDLDGRHLFVNQATAVMFGMSADECIGKRSRELLPSHIADLCEASDRAVLAAQSPLEERHIHPLPDGREATVLSTHLLLRDADGTPYAICGIIRDVTELEAAQRVFERLWVYAPEPLCMAGYDGYFKRVNPAWTRLLGWTEEELTSRPWREFIHPDDLAKTMEAGNELAAGRNVHRIVNRYRCKDGKYKWFSWDVIPLHGERTMYGFARDITEERRLEEQIRQAQKIEAVGQLASGVAHDFNNLLTVINGYTELLLSEMSPTDPRHETLSEVLQAGMRASELTSQLLAFSRKAIIEPKVLDVNQVVDSSTRILGRLIGEDVRLVTRLADVPPVKIDPGQLEQVFMNLAVNARDAMPNGGLLSIITQAVELTDGQLTESGEMRPGRYVSIIVSDTGTGISPEVQSRIFEPFFTTKGPSKGTGLGLATVYGIVRQANGMITVESKPEVGTTFRILLPAVAELPANSKLDGNNVAPLGTETILIAEDEGGVRKVAAAMLRMLGYKVFVAETGAEAVQLASEYPDPIHLLLTDVVMPDFGGRALAEKVCQLRPGVQVMYMSGYTNDGVIRSGVESSQDWFIQKPFTPLSLARRVREALDATRGA